MFNFDKYIGIPYKHLGKDFDGVDCYGLLMLIFREELGLELPDFTSLQYSKGLSEKEDAHVLVSCIDKYRDQRWKIVKPPLRRFDAVVFWGGCSKSVANHIGLMIDPEKFIHIKENTPVIVSHLDDRIMRSLHIAVRYIGIEEIEKKGE